MKTCTKCGEAKPADGFNKCASKRDGLQSNCKACRSIAHASGYAANSEKRKAYHAEYRATNPEKRKAAVAKWAAANKDKVKEKFAKWYAANSEKLNARRAANPEASRVYWHNRRARKHAAGGSLSKGLSARLFRLQRGKCACGCKQALGNNFHRDHIMPLALGGSNTDDNIQLLRRRCNSQKHAKHPVDFMRERGFLL